MTRNDVANEYFEWLYDMVCNGRFANDISYRKLLSYLHSTEFKYTIQKDWNRVKDGLNLRSKFSREADMYLDDPCSVLEMMVALSIRCEETIMDDPKFGDRTGQWFWSMIRSLGLKSMTDDNYDKAYVIGTIEKFLHRDYSPDGEGGLFTIRNCKYDLRRVEIWCQLCWYLDSIS